MLKFLNRRETGVSDPVEFYRAETTRRTYNLQLSDKKDVEKLFNGCINSLDIDLIEKVLSSNISSLKCKTTRRRLIPIFSSITDIPTELLRANEEV